MFLKTNPCYSFLRPSSLLQLRPLSSPTSPSCKLRSQFASRSHPPLAWPHPACTPRVEPVLPDHPPSPSGRSFSVAHAPPRGRKAKVQAGLAHQGAVSSRLSARKCTRTPRTKQAKVAGFIFPTTAELREAEMLSTWEVNNCYRTFLN